MKKIVKANLALAALLCGMGISTAKAQTTTTTTTTTTLPDGATGTDPVPTKPPVAGHLLIVLQTVM
jgi:hypothetical protein